MTPAQSPPLGSLRPAKLSDVPRIAIVAAAGFWHSSVFSFERPRFNRYPRDTLASYRSLYQQAILDPDSAIHVVEDDYQKDEVKEVYDALSIVYPPLEKQLPPEKLESSSVIVGVGSLSLKSDRSRCGLFQPEDEILPTKDPFNCERDRNAKARELLEKSLIGPEQRWLSGCLEITTMVTHPAYWHRGHASELTKWCIRLAEIDNIGLGVSAAPIGRELFHSLGFVEKEIVEIEGYEDHPNTISLWIGVYDPEIEAGKREGLSC